MSSLLIDVLAAALRSFRAGEDGRARRTPPAPAPPSSAAVAREEGPAAGRRLLLHDREDAVLQRVARYFHGLGYAVDMARHAEEGETLLRGHRYDLAIIDVWTSSTETLVREIRACDRETSVIVLATPLTDDVKRAARALGAEAVARPPYLPDLGHLAFSLTGVLRG